MYPKKSTSWNKVAKWYDESLRGDNMHTLVVLPGVMRMLAPKRGEKIIDLACGQGQLAGLLVKAGALVAGVDAAPELIKIARTRIKAAEFFVGDIQRPIPLDEEFDAATCVLALQNVEKIDLVFKEMSQALRSGGRAVVVINHPAFRIPRQTSWEFDNSKQMQFRRVDAYLSENRIPITMHPGERGSAVTWSFHRPMQSYIQAAATAGLVVDGLEEWISPKESRPGARSKAENRARKEFPLFMALRFRKL